jgi:hypothetical protein
MSTSGRRTRVITPVRSRSHQHLGLSLRSILFAPREGFAALPDGAISGATTNVLVFLGGAAFALVWLKIGALAGMREFCEPRYLGGYIASAALLGGVLALPTAALWSVGGAALAPLLHGEKPAPAALRFVWGASAFPLVLATLVLLPLDLVVVGAETFTTEELSEPLATAWAAFSLALGVSALAWGLWVFLRGYSAATGVSVRRATVGLVVAVAAVGLVVGALVAGTSFLSGGGRCPTP